MGCWHDTGVCPSKINSISNLRHLDGGGFSERIVRYRSRNGGLADGHGR